MNNIERTNQVYYELYSKRLGTLIIQEPEGWENDTRSFDRDKDSKGITTKTDVSLKFYGNGADFIKTIYTSFGVRENTILTKYQKSVDTISEEWEFKYAQQLDLTTYNEDSRTGRVEINAAEGGLYDEIKARESDDYNILDNQSADGKFIGELADVTKPFQPLVKGIFAESYLKDNNRLGYTVITKTYSESDSYVVRTIPLKVIYNSDEKDVTEPDLGGESYDDIPNHSPTSENEGDDEVTGNHFFEQAEQDKTIRVRLKLVFKIEDFYQRNTYANEFKVALRTSKSVNNVSLLKTHENLPMVSKNGSYYSIDPKTDRNEYTVEFDRIIEVYKGESLSLVFASAYFTALGNGSNTAKTETTLNIAKSWVKIEDQTGYDISTSRCLKPIDLFNRLVAKITSQTNIVRSSIFEEGGEYEKFVVDNGFWARQFPDKIEKEEGEFEEIQFNTSFKDAFKSFCYLEPLCWFVDIVNNQQVIRIEKATYTMQNFIGVKLESVDEIKHKSSKKDWFGNIKLGHNKSLDYEELNGLDEPNGLSLFTTPLKEKQTYEVISKYRFDSIGYELIRRKPFTQYPKEDTTRDNDIWIHDAKIMGSIYTHNRYTDIDYELPKGIFEPETAWNLRLSPMNRLVYGHGYAVKRCLYHFPTEFIRFASSNSNQNLITEKDGFELKEDGKVMIANLGTPKVEATMSTLSFRMTQELEDKFLGFTKIGNNQIPNYFGLIEYKDKGIKRYGRLVKLESSDKSKLTMINARV